MSQDFVFTVFTPTYNRAHTLPKLFSSLQEQTFEDFEWVIVDDGSTDNTEDVVQQWQDDSDFPIRYFRQENSGKPAATNRGVRQAAGELFLDIDSDDHLLPEALEILFEHWQKIPDQDKSHFAGVGGLCAYESGEIVGTPYPESPLDSEPVEIYYQLGVKGDKKWFVRTDLRRQ
ncbi:MAG: glycosyltransferase family A protein, partial [Armatimonadota bacterium]